jgi:hypothetical protein
MSLFLLFLFGFWACDPGRVDYEEQVVVTPTAGKDYGDVNALLQTAYRIDISDIFLRLDYHPREFYAEAQAEIRFETYRDQTRPIIHLDPVLNHPEQLTGLELDGEVLDPARDWRVVDGIDSNQQALEIQRVLKWKEPHTLRLRYRINLSRSYYMLNSRVSDLYGRSNEEFFPTINRFGDLIRHRIDFYVHGDMPFRCLGSGRITPLTADGNSAWRLDTLREVPSNTVMFVLIPAADTVEETRLVDGVTVRIAAFQGGASISQAFGILTPWLAELRQNFGPFPMPEGFQVFLMQDGGGMEYYGGTISSLGALAHETFHMYFGTSLVLSTYRDSWIDEAVNEWYEQSAAGTLYPIHDAYRSNMVSGRSPAGIGFDRRAYTDGARIMEHVARSIGGREAMIGFLAHLIQTQTLTPFSTTDFLTYLQNYSGLDYQAPFENWVYSGEDISAGGPGLHRDVETKHRVVIIPPASIIKRYPELSDGDEA